MDDKILVQEIYDREGSKNFSHKNFFLKILQKDERKSFTIKLITYKLK